MAPEPAEAKGFTIARSYFAMDGTPIDLGTVRQTDEIVTVLEGTMADPLERKVLVVDLLPAGFEPDTAVIDANQGDDGKFAWLKDLTDPTFRATRDDRFVAGLTLSGDNAKFKLAYVVRAVTPRHLRIAGCAGRGHVCAQLSRPHRGGHAGGQGTQERRPKARFESSTQAAACGDQTGASPEAMSGSTHLPHWLFLCHG